MLFWEKILWSLSSLLSIISMTILLLIDGRFGSDDEEDYSIRQYTIVAAGLTFCAYGSVFFFYIIPTLRDVPSCLPPVVPWLARYLNGVGTVIGCGSLVLTLMIRSDAGIYVYFAHLCGVVSIFCIIMLFRPVVTDMGAMYALCALSIGLSPRDRGHPGVLMWIALAFCILLVIIRAILESRAVVAAAAAAGQELHDVARGQGEHPPEP